MTFEEYVRLRGAALVRFARLIAGDDQLAEDLCQEVLARAYLRWHKIGRTDQPDLYLRRMVVNARASWWRRRSNRERPADVAAVESGRATSGPEAETAERDALWRRVLRLPDRQRAVIVLRYYEDLDDAAIARILDCSAVTVRTHAMRALGTLRSEPNDSYPDNSGSNNSEPDDETGAAASAKSRRAS